MKDYLDNDFIQKKSVYHTGTFLRGCQPFIIHFVADVIGSEMRRIALMTEDELIDFWKYCKSLEHIPPIKDR